MPTVKVSDKDNANAPWLTRDTSPAANPLALSQVCLEEFSKCVFLIEVTKADLDDVLAHVPQGVARSMTLILKRSVFVMKVPHTCDLLRIPFEELKAAKSTEEVERTLIYAGIQKLGD